MAKATKKENKTMWEKWGIRLSVIVGGLTAISLALGIPLAYIVLYFWQIVDSYKQCKKYNYQLSIK